MSDNDDLSLSRLTVCGACDGSLGLGSIARCEKCAVPIDGKIPWCICPDAAPISAAQANHLDLKSLAIAAAQGAAEAAAELIRFAREGAADLDGNLRMEALEALAEATATALLIQLETTMLPTDRETIGQALHALRNFQQDFQ